MPRHTHRDPIDAARARLAAAAVAIEFGAPELDIDDHEQRSPLCDFARQVAMYLTASLYGLTLTRVGELFGRHRSTVRHAIETVEEGRTDPVLDETLDRLELWLGEAAAA
ncbi:MAG: helix-turn-helix domain-containing protein [Pseudomonadota bacterium]